MYDDNWQVLADLDADGRPLRSYTWAPGIDHLLSMTVYADTATNTYYALTDHLGSVHALVDASGAIVESYEFDAWGNVLAIRDAAGLEITDHKSQISNRYLFRAANTLSHRLYTSATAVTTRPRKVMSNDPLESAAG